MDLMSGLLRALGSLSSQKIVDLRTALPPRFTSLLVYYLKIGVSTQCSSEFKIQSIEVHLFPHLALSLFYHISLIAHRNHLIYMAVKNQKDAQRCINEVLVISQPPSSQSKLCVVRTSGCDFLRYMWYHFDRQAFHHLDEQFEYSRMPYNLCFIILVKVCLYIFFSMSYI